MHIRGRLTAVAVGVVGLTSGCWPFAAPSQNGSQGNSTVIVSPNQAVNQTQPQGNDTASTGVPVNATGGGSAAYTISAATVALLVETQKLAMQGQVPGVPFADQQNFSAVQNLWGNPDTRDSAGAGIYATYSNHTADFGLNKGEQIFDVRSYSSSIRSLTLQEVESVFGSPGDVRQAGDTVIHMYPAGPDYQLLFVYPKENLGPQSRVSHISVFWPQGTVNAMAATQSPPTIAFGSADASRRVLPFRIEHPPSGYHLVELEWLPQQGPALVTTADWAQAPASGSGVPSFRLAKDSNSCTLQYTAGMRGETGIIRLIYQATSGAAMISDSDKVTLP